MSHPSFLTIVLIDDCAKDRVAYCRFLQQDSRYTYRILEFETGTAAMNWCQHETPDVILLGFALPDVDGLEFIQQFREQLRNTQSAVIMLTGQGNESIAVQAMKSGAQDYLVKSQLTPEILQNAIHHAVEQMRLLRQLEHSREQQHLIAAIALRIRQSLKLEEILQITAKEVRQFLRADRVLVYQLQPDMNGTVVAESVLPGWTVLLGVEIAETCFPAKVRAEYYQGKKRAIDDIYQAGLTDCHLQLLEQLEVKANLVVPILLTDSLWGLLIAHQCSRSRHWEATDLELLDQLGVQLSLAIQQANAYQQLQAELTERKWIEASLQASEEKLKLTLEFAHIGYWERNFITNELFASDNAVRCFGYERSERNVTSEELWSWIHPDEREWVQRQLSQAIATKTDYAVEYRVIWPDNSIHWISATGRAVYDDKGLPLLMLGVLMDISHRKQAEESLRHSEERYRCLVHATNQMVWQTDAQGNSTSFLSLWGEITGQSWEEVKHGGWLNSLHPDDCDRVHQAWSQAIATKEQYEIEYRIRSKTDEYLTFWVRGVPVLNADSSVREWVGVCTDISDRIRAEQTLQQLNQELEARVEKRTTALRENEERWQLALKGSNDGIWDWNLKTNQVFFSTRWQEMQGFAEDEMSSNVEELWNRIHPDDFKRFITALADHFAQETPFFCEEYRLQHKNGSYIWVLNRGQALWDTAGEVIRISGSATDITGRKQTESQLRSLSDRLSLALKAGAIGTWDWDLIHDAHWDDRMYELYGMQRPVGEAVYQDWGNVVHRDDLAQAKAALQAALRGEKEFDTEFRAVHPDGSIYFIKAAGIVQRNQQGEPQRMVGINYDITDRKQIEAALKESERRYATLAEASPVAIFRMDREGRCVYMNERWSEMTGRPAESALGMGWINAVHPEDREYTLMKRSQSLLKSPKLIRSEGRHLLPDGSITWFYAQLLAETDADGSFIGYIGTLTDITTRKQIEEALWESERRYASLAEASPVAIFRLDAAGNCLYVNERWYEMTGRSAEDTMGLKWLEALHPEDRDRFIRNLSPSSQPERLWQDEGRYLRPDGSINWFYVQVLPEINPDGSMVGYIGTITNITARKQAEIALKESERRYATLAEALPVGIFRFDIEGNCVYVNQRWCEMTGKPTQAALGMGWLEALYPEDRDRFIREWTQWTQVSVPGQLFLKEGRYVRPDGSINWFYSYALAETNPNGSIIGYVGTITDITERKQTEEQLRQLSERLTLAIKSGGFGIWEFDIIHGKLMWDERMYELYGVQPSEFTEAYEAWLQANEINERVRRSETEYNTEFRVVHPDGSIRFIKAYALVERNQQGESQRMIGVNYDITESKIAEQEIIRNRDLREAIFNESADAIFLVDPQTLLTIDCNRRAVELFAAAHKANLIGMNGQAFQRYQFSTEETAVIVGEMQLKGFWSREIEYVTCQGNLFWGNIAAKPITVAGRTLHLVRITDISDRKQSEEILVTYTRELADLYNNSPCGYHSLDTDGRFVNINDTELQWLGYAYEEIIGQRFIDYLTEASRLVFLHDYPQFKERGWTKDLEFDMVCKDGTILAVLLNATAVKSADGNYLCSRSSIFDISEQQAALRERKQAERELQESRTMLQLVLDTIPQRVFWKDCESRYLGCNPSFAHDYQLTPNEIIGKTDLELPWAEWGHLYRTDDAFVINTKTAKLGYEEPNVNLAGTQIWLRTSKVPLTNSAGEVIGLLGSYEDITERKQAEEQLHHTNQQLAHANIELARATRLKDEFLANMSHELRTPLNAILGMSEGFLEGVFGAVNERQIKAISTIERSGKHLLELINDILDLSKIESGKLELQLSEIPVRTLCDASISFIKQMALKKNIGLSTRIANNLGNIQVDDRRLRQVLINLLSNAIKFTPEGGSVRLEVSLEERGLALDREDKSANSPSSSHICFSVIDTGIGINPEDISKLFQPFMQLDSSLNRQYNGTGLGLALVQRIATLHGGTISVRSEVGEGSCFTVRIPYQTSDYLSTMQVTAPLPSHRLPVDNASVLIIEDSIPAAEQTTRYLSELGMQPIVYQRGEGSVEEALRVQPAFILLDLQLPNLSGWDVLNQLQTNPQTKEIPVIIISVVDERTKGLAKGAAEYIVKPINREQFQATIEKLQYPPRPASPALIAVPEAVLDSPLILLAEDNQANIDTMSGYLESRGYRLVMARNGQQALEFARNQQPDLIVMDIQMPIMDGLEAIRRLRQEQQFAHVPIIALTALAMPGDRETCLDAGANEYLSKPIKLKQLAVKIQQLLER